MKAVVCEKPGDESVLKIGAVADPTGRTRPVADPGEIRRAQPRRPDAASGVLSAALRRLGNHGPGCAGEVAAIGCGSQRMARRRTRDGSDGGRRLCRAGVGGQRLGDENPGRAKRRGGRGVSRGFPDRVSQHLHVGRSQGRRIRCWCMAAAAASARRRSCSLRKPGVRSIVTAGSDAKCEQCLKLGAEVAINYNSGRSPRRSRARPTDAAPTSFSTVSARPTWSESRSTGAWRTAGSDRPDEGCACGNRSRRDPAAASEDDRLDPAHATGKGEGADRRRAARAFRRGAEAGRLRPPIYKVVPMADVAEAHRMMAASEHFGKIVLRVA